MIDCRALPLVVEVWCPRHCLVKSWRDEARKKYFSTSLAWLEAKLCGFENQSLFCGSLDILLWWCSERRRLVGVNWRKMDFGRQMTRNPVPHVAGGTYKPPAGVIATR